MKQTFLTVDLGFGDAGKGSIVDFLTRCFDAHTVIRFSGGAQAGHRVVTAESTPREHVFSQFGAGTLAGAATHLSRFMMIEPFAMQAEAEHLQVLGIHAPFDKLTIDNRCLITTPFHRAVNRLKELARDDGRHGSCGMGIGETMSDFVTHGDDVLFAADFANTDTLYAKLQFMRTNNWQKIERLSLPKNEQVVEETAVFTDSDVIEWLMSEYAHFAQMSHIVHGTHLHDILAREGTAVFEASQGVLLDEWYGFHPHTTWSTVTLANAEMLLQEAAYEGKITKIGITRAYTTRHGAGPFVTEDPLLSQTVPDVVNGFDSWQEEFRVGWLDFVLLNYALQVVGGVDYLAVCHLDRLAEFEEIKVCEAYKTAVSTLTHLPIKKHLEDLAHQEKLTQQLFASNPILTAVADPSALLSCIQSTLNVPVGIESWGETAVDKIHKMI